MTSSEQMTIVIVEDNSSLLDFLHFAMEQLGNYTVYSAPDGVAGLEMVTLHRPQCVVIDVKMPGLDGHQLVRALRGDPSTATIPLIIMTAFAQDKDRFKGLASGADLFLTKPVMPQDLAAAIQQAITTSEEERSHRLKQLSEMPLETVTEEDS
jgi:CheY-like chemotaxis protein